MRPPQSLQKRLGLWLGLLLTALWLAAASVTAVLARQAMEAVFDSALQETAQRILPLAVAEILGRQDEDRDDEDDKDEDEDQDLPRSLAEIRPHDEVLTYVVRDAQGRTLLQSHEADRMQFPSWDGNGFRQSATHRFYNEEVLRGSIRLTLAEPLARRSAVARDIQIGLVLPLLVFFPVALLAIVLTVRASLAPLRRLRQRLTARGARDLSPLPTEALPAEVVPLAESLNGLLARLAAAFEAERSFAAHAAHELRTPLAGAIAQAQRLQAETNEPAAKARAADIETTLKRLTRLSERLMQLARAEGGRLRLDHCSDLRPLARMLTDDLSRIVGARPIALTLPEAPLMSDLDPDVFAILYRNLVENALRHGDAAAPVEVVLSGDGCLRVANEGPVLPSELLDRLTDRFERADRSHDGSGLGLAIVHAVAQRIGSRLVLKSPQTGRDSGFEACLMLPVAGLGVGSVVA